VTRAREAVCRCSVPLGDVAQQLGITVEHARDRAAHLGLVVVRDWADREALSVSDAGSVVLSVRAGIEGARLAQEQHR
jgi:hypothetical protein